MIWALAIYLVIGALVGGLAVSEGRTRKWWEFGEWAPPSTRDEIFIFATVLVFWQLFLACISVR
jgi:hypothetical protein